MTKRNETQRGDMSSAWSLRRLTHRILFAYLFVWQFAFHVFTLQAWMVGRPRSNFGLFCSFCFASGMALEAFGGYIPALSLALILGFWISGWILTGDLVFNKRESGLHLLDVPRWDRKEGFCM